MQTGFLFLCRFAIHPRNEAWAGLAVSQITLVIQIAKLQSGRRQHVRMGLFSIVILRRISTTRATGSLCWELRERQS